jgi:hypothetical protein
MKPTIKRIGQTHVVSDVAIYVNANETKVVGKTDPEVHHLLASPGVPFLAQKALKLGLVEQTQPIHAEPIEEEAETKHVKAPEETKVVSAPNSTKKKDESKD